MLKHVAHKGGLIRPYHDKLVAVVRLADGVAIYTLLWGIASYYEVTWTTGYELLGLLGVLLYGFFAEYNEVYNSWRGSPLKDEILRIIWSWVISFAVLLALLFVLKETALFSRQVLSIWFFSVYLVLGALAYAKQHLLWYLRIRGYNSRKVAIVGANPLGMRLYRAFEDMPWLGYTFMGFYDDASRTSSRPQQTPTLKGTVENLYDEVRNRVIDVVYIALPLKEEDSIRTYLAELADSTASVFIVPDLFAFDLLQARWSTLQGLPVVSVYDSPFSSLDRILKRLEDVVLSLVILSVLAIPMLLIAVGIKLSSPGPIFFRQTRYGILGDEFEILKFRTMYPNDEDGNVRQATRNDSRVTKFGRFLRRTSLDELPQFINVLQGSMSIVGPRPHAVSHNEYYRKQIYGYMLRHKVRPGITGLAQVSGFRGETDTLDKMAGRVKYDLEYIRNWSLMLDFKIIARTIFRGLISDQAY